MLDIAQFRQDTFYKLIGNDEPRVVNFLSEKMGKLNNPITVRSLASSSSANIFVRRHIFLVNAMFGNSYRGQIWSSLYDEV
jgi:hypothetical protein